MRGLAFRRHHANRKKNWAKRTFDNFFSKNSKQICIAAETPHSCSCHMCGNPRKYWKEKTLQEKKYEEKFHNDLKEIYEQL